MAVNDMPRGWLMAWVLVTSSVHAGESELERRVRILEQRLSSQALMEMMQQVNQLQQEVQALRGRVETLENVLKRIQDGQKRQYLDLDGRIRRLEGREPAPVEEAGTPLEGQPPAVDTSVSGEPAAERPSVTVPPSHLAQAPIPPSEKAKQSYRKAYNQLQAGHFDAAITAFTRFLEQHPQTTLSANAYYWLGEAYYVKRDFNAARESFRQVVEHFPASLKVPDALLKLGYVAYEQGRWKEARSLLKDVIRRYPDTHAARLAANRLERMKREGKA